MSLECPPPIDGTHFDATPGSQVTPSAPKATLGVPQMTLWAPHGAQMEFKSTPLGSQSDLPRDTKSPYGCSLGPLGVAAVVVVAVFFFRLFACVVPEIKKMQNG